MPQHRERSGTGADAETIHIVDAFNQLLSRMKVLDDSRQEFVSNVSHELKTPLTSMKVLADSLLAQPDAPAEMYREFLQDITAEIDRENQIITDLLSLVKMDKKAVDLNVSAVNINELTELICKRLRPIARKKDVEVELTSLRPVVAEVDEVKMTLIISNLVENAIKYNKEHGSVKITLDADHQVFTLEVKDTGIGIPQDSLDKIYERFYRVDKSHSREIGGTGLGLAITKNAVLMHRGSITVSYLEGGAAYFVADHVKAAKKAAFIHVDYEKAGYTRALDKDCYLAFDKIFTVSDEVREAFLKAYPELPDKTEVFHNILNKEEIVRRAEEGEGFTDGFTGMRLLSVGRLTAQKAFEVSVDAMKRLKDAGKNVRWYVLGEGDQRKKLQEQIDALGLTEDFILYGTVNNPYPFMKQADIYVHASRFEGKSIAIQEAQILGKPMVVSDFSRGVNI